MKNFAEGTIAVWIDGIVPCLKDNQTGEIVETEVVRIRRKSFLNKYNKRNGWYVNWADLLRENQIYALVLKGTVDIQGLIAVQPIEDYQAVYITWMCTAPENNPELVDKKRFIGVGGHLFAIAVDISEKASFDGAVTGNAADRKLVEHYCETFGAEHLGIIHPFQFFIDEEEAKKIKEVYEYEWTDEEL